MLDLLKLTRFWIAVAAVLAVAVNDFLAFDTSGAVDVICTIIAAAFGASAGLTAGEAQVTRDRASSACNLQRSACNPEREKP